MKHIHTLFIEELERRDAPAILGLPEAAYAHANPNAPFQGPVATTMAIGEEDGGAPAGAWWSMSGGDKNIEMVADTREMTTGMDVDYRVYGPGDAHYGSAAADTTGGALCIEVAPATIGSARHDVINADSRSGSSSIKEVLEMVVGHAEYK